MSNMASLVKINPERVEKALSNSEKHIKKYEEILSDAKSEFLVFAQDKYDNSFMRKFYGKDKKLTLIEALAIHEWDKWDSASYILKYKGFLSEDEYNNIKYLHYIKSDRGKLGSLYFSKDEEILLDEELCRFVKAWED